MENNLIMGFEFELGMLIENIPNIQSDGNLEYEPEEKIYFHVIDLLNEIDPDFDWEGVLTLKVDPTIKIENGIGIELVTEPIDGENAFFVFSCIQEVLSNQNFITNKTCGLHVNLSFADISDLRKDRLFNFYQEFCFQLAEKMNIDELNSLFGREASEYCRNNLKVEIANKLFPNDALVFKDLVPINNQFLNFYEIINNIKQDNKKDRKNFKNIAIKALKNRLKENWQSNRPAVVARRNKKSCYLEFRSIGGNYSKSTVKVNKGLRTILNEFIQLGNKLKQEKLFRKNKKII